MDTIANITRTTERMTLRDSEYTFFSLPEGRHYQYTDIYSDGRHAVWVRVNRAPEEIDSSITIRFARLDGIEDYIMWQPLIEAGAKASGFDGWHGRTESFSHVAAPRATRVLAYHLVHKALFSMGWDHVLLTEPVL